MGNIGSIVGPVRDGKPRLSLIIFLKCHCELTWIEYYFWMIKVVGKKAL